METFLRPTGSKEEIYKETLKQLHSLLAEESDVVANMANTTSLLKLNFGSYSWVGFYLMKNGRLVLGPFQGKPACVSIEVGKGVCGTAVSLKKTLIVEDVTRFPGHIVCDPSSRSEIVVPIFVQGEVVGVLDVDSEERANFDEIDEHYLGQVAGMIADMFDSASGSRKEPE